MRLTELDPRWLRIGDAPDGWKCGVSFLCPHCRDIRLAAWFDVPVRIGSPLTPDEASVWRRLAETRLAGRVLWTRSGESFETLTLSPSIDCSPDHWHGFITNGNVTGC